jgi:hypothetical protein
MEVIPAQDELIIGKLIVKLFHSSGEWVVASSRWDMSIVSVG